MKEIGGYIELDTYRLPMLHAGALALNCGRNALACVLRARGIRRLLLPELLCSSVPEVCRREGVDVAFYPVGTDFLPEEPLRLADGEWLYLVNYYGQITNETIGAYVRKYGRVIVDQAQDYFAKPLDGVDTIYTCRKWFGVADGAFLYTDARLPEPLPLDESFDRMRFLLGRFERSASEFYPEYVANNRRFADEPVKRMSKLTENLLHGIDYASVQQARRENFVTLHTELQRFNKLTLRVPDAPFMYPLLLDDGAKLRGELQTKQIYIPKLWPSVAEWAAPESKAYQMAEQILPLPIDQRYGKSEMERLISALTEVERTI